MDARDAEYRRQLGVPEGEGLPNLIGAAYSAGAAQGGKPGARRSRSRFGSGRPKQPPDIKVSAEQVRSVKCPRCLAAPDADCRDQYGQAVLPSHHQRRGAAQRQIAKEKAQRRRRDQEPVPIDKIDTKRAEFVPANQRNAQVDTQGRLRTKGWKRDSNDAVQRGTRSTSGNS